MDIITRAAKTADSRQFAYAERDLAALAVLCTPEEFRVKLDEWLAAADPNEHLDEFLRAQARRHFVWGRDLFGNIHFDGTFEPLAGEAVINAVHHREKELADVRPEVVGAALAHDALVDLILGDASPKGHIEILYPKGQDPRDEQPRERIKLGSNPPTPNDQFLSDHVNDWLDRLDRQPTGPIPVPAPGGTGFGSVIYPKTARGTLVPPSIVNEMGGRRRYHPLDEQGNLVNDRPGGRHFRAVQKRMIRLRDNTCQHPGCQTPHHHCDHDHITPHNSRGPTLVANGQLLCPPVRRLRRAAKQQSHHRWKHRHDHKGSQIFRNSPIQLE